MKLCELKVGGYFKLAERASERNRLYEKSKWEYEDGIICYLPGSCHQFLIPCDKEIVEFDTLDAMVDTIKRMHRNSKRMKKSDYIE